MHGPQQSGDGPRGLRNRLSPTRDGRPQVPAAEHLAGLSHDRPRVRKEAEASPSPRVSLDGTTPRERSAGRQAVAPLPPALLALHPDPTGQAEAGGPGPFWTAGPELRSSAAGTRGLGNGSGRGQETGTPGSLLMRPADTSQGLGVRRGQPRGLGVHRAAEKPGRPAHHKCGASHRSGSTSDASP